MSKFQSQYCEALKRKYKKCQEHNKNLVLENAKLRKQNIDDKKQLNDIRRKMVGDLNAQLDEQDLSMALVNEKVDEQNTKISKLEKDLADKTQELEQEKEQHSRLKIENSSQRRNFLSDIKRLEQSPALSYTYSQVERDQQEKSNLQNQLEDQAGQIRAMADELEEYKKISENSVAKFNKQNSELDRYHKILVSLFSLINCDSNYYDQTTPFFESRHLLNRNLNCEFEISATDRIYKDFLNLVGPEARIRIKEIVEKGEFSVNKAGKTCDVNTVIFGKTLDMDARKSSTGLSLCFTEHKPSRLHKNHREKINHYGK